MLVPARKVACCARNSCTAPGPTSATPGTCAPGELSNPEMRVNPSANAGRLDALIFPRYAKNPVFLFLALVLPVAGPRQAAVAGLFGTKRRGSVSGARSVVPGPTGVEQHAVTGPDGRFQLTGSGERRRRSSCARAASPRRRSRSTPSNELDDRARAGQAPRVGDRHAHANRDSAG